MPDQFEVGQRVYWAGYDCPDFSFSFGTHIVASGVVVTTGPAISTIWADEGSSPPHMATKANDKVTANRDDVVAEIAPKNEKITATWKAMADAKQERLAAEVAAWEKGVETLPRRRGWGRR